LKDIKYNNGALQIVLEPKKILSNDEIDGIKTQLYLTYREFDNVNEIDISLGEEAFILKR